MIPASVRLAVLQRDPCCPGKGKEGTELIFYVSFHFLRCADHVPAAEALQVRVSRVRADSSAGLFREPDGLFHDERVAGVKAAGDVGR